MPSFSMVFRVRLTASRLTYNSSAISVRDLLRFVGRITECVCR